MNTISIDVAIVVSCVSIAILISVVDPLVSVSVVVSIPASDVEISVGVTIISSNVSVAVTTSILITTIPLIEIFLMINSSNLMSSKYQSYRRKCVGGFLSTTTSISSFNTNRFRVSCCIVIHGICSGLRLAINI